MCKDIHQSNVQERYAYNEHTCLQIRREKKESYSRVCQ